MTLQLPASTRIALVDAMRVLLDVAGGVSLTGYVQFIDGVGGEVARIQSGASGPNPGLPFFNPAQDDAPNNRSFSDMAVSNIEDSNNTVGGTIAWAVFRDGDGNEHWRSDVGPAGTDIIMSNPNASPNDPVRLSTYEIRSQQDN